ncbi:unnamed protein product [Musa acuminata subsp. burmannicoides]
MRRDRGAREAVESWRRRRRSTGNAEGGGVRMGRKWIGRLRGAMLAERTKPWIFGEERQSVPLMANGEQVRSGSHSTTNLSVNRFVVFLDAYPNKLRVMNGVQLL